MNSTDGRQLRLEKAAGLVLVAATAVALVAANSALAGAYRQWLHLEIGPALPVAGRLDLHHWIADGLMAIFFLLVGLEVKREWLDGQLGTPEDRRLPIIAAAGGMLLPALVYLMIAGDDPGLARGWAIPAATDIAFAIAVLAILGRHAPPAIKLLLVAIAIVDDIGAVLIIAFFYSGDLQWLPLAAALLLAGAMAMMGRLGMMRLWPYLAGFAVLWLLVLASGVHATIAGVLAALTVPLGKPGGPSPLRRLEHAIHPWVMFGVVPLFGLASAGVELKGGVEALGQGLPLAILAGLFLGKQVGVFGSIWAADRLGFARRPAGSSWRQLYGASLLCGIGFTMSLFIGALAFPGHPELVDAAKIGTLAGSLLSALAGYAVLRSSPEPGIDFREDEEEAAELFGGPSS